MSNVWVSDAGWTYMIDDAGHGWRYDALAGWVREAKYDAPDSARGGKCG